MQNRGSSFGSSALHRGLVGASLYVVCRKCGRAVCLRCLDGTGWDACHPDRICSPRCSSRWRALRSRTSRTALPWLLRLTTRALAPPLVSIPSVREPAALLLLPEVRLHLPVLGSCCGSRPLTLGLPARLPAVCLAVTRHAPGLLAHTIYKRELPYQYCRTVLTTKCVVRTTTYNVVRCSVPN